MGMRLIPPAPPSPVTCDIISAPPAQPMPSGKTGSGEMPLAVSESVGRYWLRAYA